MTGQLNHTKTPVDVVLSWSGGKDSALALHALQKNPRYRVVGLLTTIAERYDRVSHHGVRSELIQMQANAIGLPLKKIMLTDTGPCSCINERYEDLMRRAMLEYIDRGVKAVAFGDIFLEELRDRRVEKLAQVDMQALFPVWGRDTGDLLREFVDQGFKSIVSCVVTDKLDASFAGRVMDQAFIADLPDSVDPCGENGEYHSFVFDGPIFKEPLRMTLGESVLRDVRCFVDILPAHATQRGVTLSD